MSTTPLAHSEQLQSTITNQLLCAKLSLLFMLLYTALSKAIAETGGTYLASQFEQQINHYATQHGWTALTGLNSLAELKESTPDVESKMLAAVYVSYAQYACLLARRILGHQLLAFTLMRLLNSLSPELAQFNAQHGIIRF